MISHEINHFQRCPKSHLEAIKERQWLQDDEPGDELYEDKNFWYCEKVYIYFFSSNVRDFLASKRHLNFQNPSTGSGDITSGARGLFPLCFQKKNKKDGGRIALLGLIISAII